MFARGVDEEEEELPRGGGVRRTRPRSEEVVDVSAAPSLLLPPRYWDRTGVV